MARRRFSSMPRVKRRKSYWLANTGSKALVLEPGEGTPNGAGLFLPEASNQILSLTNPQTFDEADTLIGLRGYCWLRFNPEAGSRALAHVNIRLVQFENISQITLSPVMGRADDGNEGPSSENLLWAGHCHTLCDDQAYPREFKVTDIESKAKRKLVSESGIYISASLDTFWNANLPAAVTLEWVIRGLFLRG